MPAGGRTVDTASAGFGIAERPELGPEHAAGLEGLQLLGLAVPFVALADVDVGRDRGVSWARARGRSRRRGGARRRSPAARSRCASGTGAASAGSRRGRRATWVRISVPRSITRPIRLQPLAEPDAVDDRRRRRERAANLPGLHARSERRVTFRVERLGVGHPAGHPEDDDGVGPGLADPPVDVVLGR